MSTRALVAAGRLQSPMDSRDYSRDLLVMNVQLRQIADAVKSTVPQEMRGEIVEKLEELEQGPEAVDVGTDSFDDDDDPFDPTEFIDDRRVLTSQRPPSPRTTGTAADVDGAFAV